MGFEPRIIPANYVKPFNKGQKNDYNDAETIAEALYMGRAGQTFKIIDHETGEVRQAQFFCGSLGASNLTYAEATWTQGLSDWIGSHTRAFAFFGGVTVP